MKYDCLVNSYALALFFSFIDASLATDDEDNALTVHSSAIMKPSVLTQMEQRELKKQADLEDFEIIPREEINASNPTTQNLNPPKIDEEVKELITQGGATVVSGGFGYFSSNIILQSGLTYLGYKIAVKVLPPVLDYYNITVSPRYAYPVYRAREYVLQKGSDGLNYLYKVTPSLTEVMNRVSPLPPPEDLEMMEY